MLNTIFLKSILLFVLIINILTIDAQINDDYTRGTILFKNNETKVGYVRNDNLGEMNYSVNFKSTLQSEQIETYDTASVKAIIMEQGEVYELLRYKPHLLKNNISILARLIVKGKASLYKVSYKGEVVYIIQNNQKTFPLQDDEIPINSTLLIQNHFIEYLKDAFEDYEDLISKIEKTSFFESSFKSLIKEYNDHFSSESKVIKFNEKSNKFLFFNMDGRLVDQNNQLFSIEGNFRVYYPRFSKSTSINLGLKYWNNKNRQKSSGRYTVSGNLVPGYFDTIANYTQSYIAIPFSIHENILNKKFRPYLFLGFTFYGFYSESNNVYKEDIGTGWGNKYFILFSFGAGIEADIYKGLMVRSEYRFENKLITFGLGYHFPLNFN